MEAKGVKIFMRVNIQDLSRISVDKLLNLPCEALHLASGGSLQSSLSLCPD